MSEPLFASGFTLPPEPGAPVVDAPVTIIPPGAEAPPGETTPPAASEPPAAGSEEEAALQAQQGKANRPFVSRLIRENERQKAETARLQAQIDVLSQQLRQGQPQGPEPGPLSPAVPAANLRPDPSGFVSHDDYIVALSRWGAREEAVALRQAEQRETQQQTAARVARAAQTEWDQLVHKGRNTYEDFDEVANQAGYADSLVPALNRYMRASPDGAALLYHLGNHPVDVQTLNQLDPIAAARWLGLLEARLNPGAPVVPPRAANSREPPPAPLHPVGAEGTSPILSFQPGISLGDYERLERARIRAARG